MINRLPDGTGGSPNANFMNTVLDDKAVAFVQSQSGPVTNTSFKPGSPLSGFDDKTGNGTWTLKVIDQEPFDAGTITGWFLTITPKTLACAAYTPSRL